MEWWYYNGHLEAADGRVFSLHYVAFLVNSVVPYTALQVSLVDHRTGRRIAHQRSSPGNPSAGSGGGFAFTLGGWSMAGSGGQDRLKVEAPGLAFDLALSNPGPTVFHGGSGLLDFGDAGTSYYYSRPRMAAQGTLTLEGLPFQVKGPVWFDHQWGDFQPLDLGWDWFSLQLDDGSDVMLYRLRGRDGRTVLESGTWTRDGTSATLLAGDFTLTPAKHWTSPGTGIAYPVAWKLSIPSRSFEATLEPVVEACEFDARGSTLLTYWEGAVRIRGTHVGRGFMEICPLRPRKPGP
jgi:predicted secreted hydrolase